jgi:lipoprotein-releasing system ATP-binding protein
LIDNQSTLAINNQQSTISNRQSAINNQQSTISNRQSAILMFIEVSNLSKSYPVGNTRLTVLKGLDVSLERGEMVAVVGASGVGKSTLLHVLGGLDAVDSGTVRIGETMLTALSDADVVAYRNRHVGFVFQFHHLLPEFTALENAEMPMRIARRPAAERRQRAADLLHRVGLDPRLDHRPGMLSGGEQQRVAIARALVMQPTLLLADEPTGDLDEPTANSLHALLREMHTERGLTSIIATHNTRLAAACDRVLRLEDGQLKDAGSADPRSADARSADSRSAGL